MKSKFIITKIVALLVLVVSLSGCCTPALWKKKDFSPAENPNLRLSWSPDASDILVQYDECCGTNRAVQPRAYWLFAYEAKNTNLEARPKPTFVEASNFLALATIPIVTNTPTTDEMATNNWLAVTASDPSSFTLWLNSTNQGDYTLPVYRAAPFNAFGRILLTPGAAALDAAAVGVFIGAAGVCGGGLVAIP